MSDFFAVELGIKFRIAEQLPEIRGIYSLNDKDNTIITPSILVAFEGAEPINDQSGSQLMLRQMWSVSLILPARYTIAEIGTAGFTMAELIRVLSNYSFDGCVGPLTYLDTSQAEQNDMYLVYKSRFSADILLPQTSDF